MNGTLICLVSEFSKYHCEFINIIPLFKKNSATVSYKKRSKNFTVKKKDYVVFFL